MCNYSLPLPKGKSCFSKKKMPTPVNFHQLLQVPWGGFRGPWSMAGKSCHPYQWANYTFISQFTEQKHLSKGTQPSWMQAAGIPWGLSSEHQIVSDICSCWEPILKHRASIQPGWGNGVTQGDPTWPTLCFSKANMRIGVRNSGVLNQRQFFLALAIEVIPPRGPRFADKEPVTHGSV